MLIRQILLIYLVLFTTFMHIQYIQNYLLSQTVSNTTSNNGGPQHDNFGMINLIKTNGGCLKINDNDNNNNNNINIPINLNGTHNNIILYLTIINNNNNIN